MVAGPDGDIPLIQKRRQVVRVNARKLEEKNRSASIARTIDFYLIHFSKFFESIDRKAPVVGLYSFQTDCLDKIDSRGQPDGSGDILRSRLEFPRQLVPGGIELSYVADHVAAKMNRIHLFEPLAPAV